MQFKIGPKVYRVKICPGRLARDGEPRGAVVHGRTVLINGEVDPEDRLQVLVDQLRMIVEGDLGISLPPSAVAAFTVDVFRQVTQQGGETALCSVKPGAAKVERLRNPSDPLIWIGRDDRRTLFRVRVVHGMIRRGDNPVYAFVDYDAREILVSDRLPPDARCGTMARAVSIAWAGVEGIPSGEEEIRMKNPHAA